MFSRSVEAWKKGLDPRKYDATAWNGSRRVSKAGMAAVCETASGAQCDYGLLMSETVSERRK